MAWPSHLALADRAVLEHLGGPVIYEPFDGDAVEVTGVFDEAYVRADVGHAGISGSGPAVFFRLSDLPSDPEVDDPTIIVNGSRYRVREVEPDGQGGVHLLLHRKG